MYMTYKSYRTFFHRRPKAFAQHLHACDEFAENFVRCPAYNSKGLPLRVILASRVSYPKPGLTV